ncbi:Uma2 family endonuclease [bacterium]|nr:MAG: Uma2 family endonuclease [bacterium]
MDAAILTDPLLAIDEAGEGKFEFAGGRLIPVAPQSHDHIDQSWFLTTLLKAVCETHGAGYAVGDGFAQRLDMGTVRVPDVAYFRPESLARVHATYSEGGADLVVEIVSLDSQARDRGEKFVEYERAGVEEYWIVDPIRRTATFYRLEEGVYRPVSPDSEDRVHSSVLPGFFVRIAWLWSPPTLVDALRELGLL